MLKTLASEMGIVLLPGNGFDDLHPSARVSLANLRECDYRNIGSNIRQQLDNLYSKYKNLAKPQNQIDFCHTNYYNITFSDLAVKHVENNRIIP